MFFIYLSMWMSLKVNILFRFYTCSGFKTISRVLSDSDYCSRGWAQLSALAYLFLGYCLSSRNYQDAIKWINLIQPFIILTPTNLECWYSHMYVNFQSSFLLDFNTLDTWEKENTLHKRLIWLHLFYFFSTEAGPERTLTALGVCNIRGCWKLIARDSCWGRRE